MIGIIKFNSFHQEWRRNNFQSKLAKRPKHGYLHRLMCVSSREIAFLVCWQKPNFLLIDVLLIIVIYLKLSQNQRGSETSFLQFFYLSSRHLGEQGICRSFLRIVIRLTIIGLTFLMRRLLYGK